MSSNGRHTFDHVGIGMVRKYIPRNRTAGYTPRHDADTMIAEIVNEERRQITIVTMAGSIRMTDVGTALLKQEWI